MPTIASWLAFITLCVVMVATPGPNLMAPVSRWLLVERWVMGSVLGALAARMALESRR